MISRTGYTGERGYELFVRSQDAAKVWDTIVAEGAEMGIIPCCFSVLDMLRWRATCCSTPMTIRRCTPMRTSRPATRCGTGPRLHGQPGKTGFGGRKSITLKGKERFKIFGLLIEADGPADLGDEVWADGRKVGVITCPCYSTLTGKSMAIARLDVDKAVQGTPLEVKGKTLSAPAIAHTLPFDDPEKKKRTAVG